MVDHAAPMAGRGKIPTDIQHDVQDVLEVLMQPSQKYISRIRMGRAAVPEDFVGAVIFLASSAGSMVTAHVLSVVGGALGG